MPLQSPSDTASNAQKIAIPPKPPRFEGRERELLDEALKQDCLFYLPEGRLVSRMLSRACEAMRSKYAVATSSGSASIHAAVAAAGVTPGAEVITSPITDMGSVIGILYQNAIPVFADVDPRTYHITAQSIERVMSDRTQAVIVVHLTGSPADLDPIAALCKRRGVKLIEDCAQAFGCKYKDRFVGTIGDMGCFSLNDYKHLSSGDGGFILTDDQELFYACHNYADKFYDRHSRGVRLTRLAPNYRMSELQGAVALAQFDRLNFIAQTRNRLGTRLTEALRDIPGILTPEVVPGGFASYWFYLLRVDEKKFGLTREELAGRLCEAGVPATAYYIGKPLYREPLFASKSFFPGNIWPAEVISGRKYDYNQVTCPNAEKVLQTSIHLAIHEGMTDVNMDAIANVFRNCG